MSLIKLTGSIIEANTITSENIATGAVTQNNLAQGLSLSGIRISAITYPGDDTAANTAGGQSIVLTGAGFESGAAVLVDYVSVGSVTVTNTTSISFTAPAKSAGGYLVHVINPDGATAIHVPGIQYSGTPAWSTAAGSVGSFYEYTAVSNTVAATSDSTVQYSVVSGSLPTGATMNGNGVITGTAPAESGATTFTFTVRANDAENQSTDRTFTITVNPDVVDWSAPANNATITTYEYVPISNTFASTSRSGMSVSYAADTLPANVTISGATVSGTPTTVGNTTSVITATAATTGKTSTQTLNFAVQQDSVTWSSPANNTTYTLNQNIANTSSLSATSAAGFNVSYSANVLPAGMSISGNTITGTPTVVGNTTSLITATAATTNRTATRVLNWVVMLAIDQNWKHTSFLLSSNTSLSTGSFVLDRSKNSYISTVAGNTMPISFSPLQHGYYSNQFNGANTYMTAAYNSAFNFDAGVEMCFEGWIRPTSFATSFVMASRNWNYGGSGPTWGFSAANATSIEWSIAGTGVATYVLTRNQSLVAPYNIPLDEWTHVAFTRDTSNKCRIFVNGYLVASQTYASALTSASGDVYLGVPQTGSAQASGWANGFMSNLRIMNGSMPSEYATSSTTVGERVFIPPTAPLSATGNTALLLCNNNRFDDTSTSPKTTTKSGDIKTSGLHPFVTIANSTIRTYGSGYFDGDNDYVTVPYDVPLGNSNFTIEFWVYPLTAPNNNWSPFFSLGANGGGKEIRISQNINGTGWGWLYPNDASSADTYAGFGTLPLNQWHHIAMTRDTGTARLFLNGALVSNAAVAFNHANTTLLKLTMPQPTYADGSTSCYMHGLHIVKGNALYTAAFTPSRTITTPTANTTLLTLQYNGRLNNNSFKDGSDYGLPLTKANTASASTFSPYGYNWSNYFDGSNYVATQNTVSAAMGGGFAGNIISIEMFVHPTNFYYGSYDSALIGAYQAVAANGRWIFYATRTSANSTTLGVSYTTSTGSQNSVVTANNVLYQNQWNHVAVTIDATTSSSATIKIYANGVLAGSWTGQNMSTHTTYYDTPRIGGLSSSYVSNFVGHIANLRILKGELVYNADTYTVPTRPHADTSNTVLIACQANRFIDMSSRGFTLTPTSNNVTISRNSPFSTLASNNSNYSLSFNGTTDYIKVPASSTYQAWDWSGSWTIEGWYNFRTVAGSNGLFTYPDLLQAYYDGTSMRISYRSNANWYDNISTVALQANRWYHIALVVNGSSMRCYVDGTAIGTATTGIGAGARGSTTGFGEYIAFGCNDVYTFGSPDTYFNGLISNLRISKVAVYTGNFTVPTTPLSLTQSSDTNISALTAGQVTLLACKDNIIVDNTPNYWSIVAATTSVVPSPLSPFTQTYSDSHYDPSVFGGSVYLDGSGDMVYRTMSSPSPYTIPGDFTLECWAYPTGTEASYIFMYSSQKTAYTADIGIIMRRDMGQIVIAGGSGGGTSYTVNFPANTVVTPGRWQHLALVRSANTIYAFLNGVRSTSGTAAAGTIAPYTYRGDLAGPGGFYIGTTDANWTAFSPTYFAGHVSDVRLTIGTALYTNSFYPTTTALPAYATKSGKVYKSTLLLSGVGEGGVVDASRNSPTETVGDVKAVDVGPYSAGYYSNYFDGTGDYLGVSSNTNFEVGTGDFTIEFWAFWTTTPSGSVPGNMFYTASYGTTGSTSHLGIYITSTQIQLARYNTGSDLTASVTETVGSWNHYAISRTSGTARIFKNGILVNSGPVSTSYSQSGITIGGQSGAGFAGGYVSNLRFIKGQSLYTSDSTFTPSTTPLTAVSGTSLLTCQSNTFKDNSTNNFTITRSGDTKVVTQNPFSSNTGLSYYFDGTGDYVTVPYNSLHQLAVDDFTIEAWIYRNVAGAEHNIAVTRSSSGTDGWNVRVNSTNTLQFYFTGGGSVTSSGTIPAGAWTHIAVVKIGNTASLYINGTNDGTNTSIGTGNVNTQPLRIGVDNSNAAGYMNGYITDLRITKGVGRSITVPTEPYMVK